MRVCDLTTLYIDEGEGGVNTYLREKAAYFARARPDIEHSLIVPASRNEVRRLGRSRLYCVKSPRYFRNPQHRLLLNNRAITRILREVKPNLVEADGSSLLARVAARALRHQKPAIVGFYHVHLATFFARKLGSAFGRMTAALFENVTWHYTRQCLQPCDRVVVSSIDIVQRLKGHALGELVHIPLGVNTDLFRPIDAPENGDTLARNDRVTILFVGRLSKEKDLPVLFAAFERLQPSKRYHLQIVGDGPLRSEVEEFAQKHDNVTCLGLCPYGQRLAEIYRQADIVAIPSPAETFGLTILEALASGVPVVGIRQGGPARILTPELGALATPGDPADFAEKIEHVARGRFSRQRCRNVILKEYSWTKTFDRLSELYGELLGVDQKPEACATDRKPISRIRNPQCAMRNA
jgi:alpha-1,6-mannosyltransferase